jgi:hypothetical protein
LLRVGAAKKKHCRNKSAIAARIKRPGGGEPPGQISEAESVTAWHSDRSRAARPKAGHQHDPDDAQAAECSRRRSGNSRWGRIAGNAHPMGIAAAIVAIARTMAVAVDHEIAFAVTFVAVVANVAQNRLMLVVAEVQFASVFAMAILVVADDLVIIAIDNGLELQIAGILEATLFVKANRKDDVAILVAIVVVVLDAVLAVALVVANRKEIEALDVRFAVGWELNTFVISVFPAINIDCCRAGDAGNGERQAGDAKTN